MKNEDEKILKELLKIEKQRLKLEKELLEEFGWWFHNHMNWE